MSLIIHGNGRLFVEAFSVQANLSEGLSEGNPETQRAFAVEGTARPLMSLLQPGYR